MLLTDLVRLYPELFHMADEHSWPSIQRHGLLPTNALLDRWEVETPGTEALLSRVRPDSVVIEHDTYGSAVIRDQKPLNHEALASALVDLSVEEWLDELNSRSFMFLQRERLFTLLNARSYRDRAHLVITIDTASLVRGYEDRIELCRINSGFAQPHSKAARGRDTFQRIYRYAHPIRDGARDREPWDVAELTIPGGVPDLLEHVTRVDRMQGATLLETIYQIN
jgi:hypothetical protein